MGLPDLGDARWAGYRSGYGLPYDVRPLIRRLSRGECDEALRSTVWDELHHQGDVGEASYALVACLPSFVAAAKSIDSNPLSFAAVVEIERQEGNPPIPEELAAAYRGALFELPASVLARPELPSSSEFTQAIAACVAAALGQHHLARAYLDFDESDALSYLEETIGFTPSAAT